MEKKLERIVEITCEEDVKEEIVLAIQSFLEGDSKWSHDYKDGNILIKSDRFETVDVVIFEGVKDIRELITILTN